MDPTQAKLAEIFAAHGYVLPRDGTALARVAQILGDLAPARPLLESVLEHATERLPSLFVTTTAAPTWAIANDLIRGIDRLVDMRDLAVDIAEKELASQQHLHERHRLAALVTAATEHNRRIAVRRASDIIKELPR